MARMLWEKRQFAERGLVELTAAVERALRPGDVPALAALPPRSETAEG
jgi:hypothetical protein